MPNALVTGGAGFIGSHLCDRLLRDGYEVVAIDNLAVGREKNLTKAQAASAFTFAHIDINDPRVAEHFEGVDVVFHLAALADIVPSIENPEGYFRSNVDGTFAVLEHARRAGVKRFVYAASSSCYGIPDVYPTPETVQMRPQYPYALTKMLGEQLVLHWAQVYGLSAISLRFFNVFGPRARTSGTYGAVFGVFLAQKLAGKPFTVVGDGEQTRDFTYVSDIVDGLVTAAASGVANEVINLGSGGTYSINRLVGLLGGPVEYIPKRPGEPDCTFADVSKAKRLLNWSASVPFEEGVAHMLEHIDSWRDAPVWDAGSIAAATASWFKYLNKSGVASE